MNVSEDSTVLSSWKDIAKYLGKGVRTVQRWERHLGLPVRRPNGASQKSAVLLYRGDVDAWLATRFSARALRNEWHVAQPIFPPARSTLREGIRTARALRNCQSSADRTDYLPPFACSLERCDLLATQDLRVCLDFCRSSSAAELMTPDLLPFRTPTWSLPNGSPEPQELHR